MTPEQLVPTLETCKKLKDAGYPQDTHFCWLHEEILEYTWIRKQTPNSIAAPTFQELLGELPEYIDVGDVTYHLHLVPDGKHGKTVGYYSEEISAYLLDFTSNNPAEAAALLFLELHKKGGE